MGKEIALTKVRQQILKVCSRCKKEKLVSKFSKDKRSKDGLTSSCKICKAARKKALWEKNPEHVRKQSRDSYHKNKTKHKLKRRRRGLKDRLAVLGLTVADYSQMVEDQKGLCAICGLPEVGKLWGTVKTLATDHNHNTGKVRGLLCQKCNQAIGLLKVDDQGTRNLQCAIKYLEGK